MLGNVGKLYKNQQEHQLAIDTYKQALEVSLPAWEAAMWNWWLRQQVGGNFHNLFELYKIVGNMNEAAIAGKNWLTIWGHPMHGVNASQFREIHDESATADQINSMAKVVLKEYGMKRFTIPTDFGGIKYPFHVYITDVPWPTDPLADQARWVSEMRGGTIPEDVRESFRKLHKIAHENNVPFTDLAVYALGNANKEESTDLPANKPSE